MRTRRALAAAFFLVGAAVMCAVHFGRPAKPAISSGSARTSADPAPIGFVRAYSANHPPENAIPADASARERQLLTELSGLPLLVVRDEHGQIAQVHVFER
jgi:hypothetical protein